MRLMIPEWKELNTPTYVLTGEEDEIADTANYSFAKKNGFSDPLYAGQDFCLTNSLSKALKHGR